MADTSAAITQRRSARRKKVREAHTELGAMQYLHDYTVAGHLEKARALVAALEELAAEIERHP